MSIFGRYVFRQAGSALVLILLSLSGVVWIALALRQLNIVTSHGQDAFMLVQMTTLAVPNMMALIAPVALLVAVIHVLNRLNGDSELIVLTASGANMWHVARPLLALALVVAIAISTVNHYVMPMSLRVLRDFVVQVRTDLIAQVLQPGRFSSPERGLTIHIRSRDLNGRLSGLLMDDRRNAEATITYLAERADLVKQDGTMLLLMEKGHVLRSVDWRQPPQIIAFQSYAVDLERFEPKSGYIELKPRERFFNELAFPAPDDKDFQRQPGQFRAELHERFANPLYPLAFVLIAVAFIGRAQSTRQNRWQATALAGGLAVGCRMCGLAANNLVVLDAKWLPLMYGIPLAAIVVSSVMISSSGSRSWRFRRRAGASELDDALSPAERLASSAVGAAR